MNFLDTAYIKLMSFEAVNMQLTGNIVGDVVSEVGKEQTVGGEAVTKINALGASGVQLVMRFSIFGAIIAIIVTGVLLVFANGQEREEQKKKLIWAAVGVCLIVGAPGIIMFLASFSSQLFPTN